MENFDNLGLPKPLLVSLERIKFTKPTPVQAATIPLALAGRDVLGSAQTGTGKTGAFGIPIIAKLLNEENSGTALVITPTRELATQVMQALTQMLGHDSKIKSALLIGGDPIMKQLQRLRARPELIVGTPGRINDHLNRGTLDLSKTDFLVLDETDRMLDMGFTIQIDEILESVPNEGRQTLLFSATLPSNIVRIAKKYLNNPEHISIGDSCAPAQNIKQDVLYVDQRDKYNKLLDQLNEREGSVIVFVKTKIGAQRIADNLNKSGHLADSIHGDLRQHKRDRVINAFRKQKYRIMVATDIAARGLDIPHIEHVVNYDLPQCPEDYIHRIGRTARAGATGEAICFVSPAERRMWGAITNLMDPNSKKDSHFSNDRKQGRGSSSRGRSRDGERSFSSRRRDDDRPSAGRRPRDGERSFSPRGRDGDRPSAGRRDDRSFSPHRRDDRSSAGRGDERSFSPRRRDDDRPSAGRRDERSFSPRGRDGDRPSTGRRDDRSSAGRGDERSFSPRRRDDDRQSTGRRDERSFSPRGRDGDRPSTDRRSRDGEKSFGSHRAKNEGSRKSFSTKASELSGKFGNSSRRDSSPRSEGAKKTFKVSYKDGRGQLDS